MYGVFEANYIYTYQVNSGDTIKFDLTSGKATFDVEVKADTSITIKETARASLTSTSVVVENNSTKVTGIASNDTIYLDEDIVFTVEAQDDDHTVDSVKVTIDGTAYKNQPLTEVGGKYTIPAAWLTGATKVTITVTQHANEVTVTFTTNEITDTTVWVKVGTGEETAVKNSDTVKVPYGGSLTVRLADGSNVKVEKSASEAYTFGEEGASVTVSNIKADGGVKVTKAGA